MSNKNIRLDGKKHSMPGCFVRFYYDLESLVGVETVGTGSFIHARGSNNRRGYKIKYYNPTDRILKVTARKYRVIQDFYLRIDPSKREEIEEYIGDYRN